MDSLTDLPSFLRSPEGFSQHLQDQLSEQSNPEKGDSFVGFACKVLPFFDFWKGYKEPKRALRKTHDGGIDFLAQHQNDNTRIAGQSKLRIREIGEFDTIISKFSNYEISAVREAATGQGDLFVAGDSPIMTFLIITSSNLAEIRRRYEQSSLPSLESYRKLHKDGRLHIVDGPQLLKTLQDLYRQSYLIAPEIEIEFVADILEIGNAYISAITAKTLRSLYERYGSSLFFENIRDFLGISGNGDAGDSNVNHAIVNTLEQCPAMMLGRNNGITFRADTVAKSDQRRVTLHKGSIVNGCQTTMCIVNVGEIADAAMVAVKIVVDDDSWEVAKSANHQNRVTRIDLEIARFLRPQLMRKVATDLGYGMSAAKEPNISNVLADIHLAKISYDAIKLLYLGFFSRHPNNLFEGVYSEVRLDVLNVVSEHGQHERILRILFQLWMQLGRASDSWRERFTRRGDERTVELFKRFFEQEKVKYHCLLAILTACGCINNDLMKKPSGAEDAYADIARFFDQIEIVLTTRPEYFDRVFQHAFGVITERVLTQSRGDVQKEMFRDVVSSAGAQFGGVVQALRTRMASDDSLDDILPSGIP